MRVSKETAAAHRGAIVAAAGRLFRAHGVAGVAVAEITRACGLTHGGFYGHFASKEALAAEAIAGAFAEGLARLEAAPDLATYVRIYLSRSHRDAPEDGCVMVALAAEAGRCGEAADRAFAEGIDAFTTAIAARWPGPPAEPEVARARAAALLSLLVGGMSLARILARTDPEGSTRHLAALRAQGSALLAAENPSVTR